MKKNIVSIVIILFLVLISMLISGIVLKTFEMIWVSVGAIMAISLAIAVYKIIKLFKDSEDCEDNKNEQIENASNTQSGGRTKTFFLNQKNAWHFSSKGERIKCILFMLTFIVCCTAFMVLSSYGYIRVSVIVWLAGVAAIVVAIIIMAIIEKVLIKQDKLKRKSKKQNDDQLANSVACESVPQLSANEENIEKDNATALVEKIETEEVITEDKE